MCDNFRSNELLGQLNIFIVQFFVESHSNYLICLFRMKNDYFQRVPTCLSLASKGVEI